MGIEFSKPAVIKVIMDAMAGLDLQDLYDKVEAMEEPTQPAITEHQALSKIAERFPMTTDQIVSVLERAQIPTQPELVEVPEFVADWYEENKHELENSIWEFCASWRGVVTDDFSNWMSSATSQIETLIRMKDGYTVKKEQLYYVKVGIMAFMDWDDSFVAKMCTTDSTGWENMAAQLSLDKAEGVAVAIGGEAVPVDQEPKLPQEIELSEYLEEEY